MVGKPGGVVLREASKHSQVCMPCPCPCPCPMRHGLGCVDPESVCTGRPSAALAPTWQRF